MSDMSEFHSLWQKCISLYNLTDSCRDFNGVYRNLYFGTNENGGFFVASGNSISFHDAEGVTPEETLKDFIRTMEDVLNKKIKDLKEEGNRLLTDADRLKSSFNKVK